MTEGTRLVVWKPMSTDRGLRGVPDRALGIRIAAPLALLLALLTSALVAPAANADTIAAKRQEANRIYLQIQQSQRQLEGVIQKYDAATVDALKCVARFIRSISSIIWLSDFDASTAWSASGWPCL